MKKKLKKYKGGFCMKIRRRNTIVGIFTAVAFLGLILAACEQPTGDQPNVAVSGVTLNKNTLALPVEQAETLIATVQPENATNKTVNWTSSNPAIATVNTSGKVEAKTIGLTTITVTTADGNKTATCNVTVTSLVASISVTNPPNKTLYRLGEDLDITGLVVTATYTNGSKSPIDMNISYISGFNKTVGGVQTLTITYGGKTATFTVTVVVPVTDISGVQAAAVVGTPLALSGTVIPPNATKSTICMEHK
jgi:hypothetical protein